jgi:hypothetical protein
MITTTSRESSLSSSSEKTGSSFKKTIKERLTEGGASGAFFFFTKDEKFIAKSCTLEEIAHIRRSSLMLANYFQENPESFITRVPLPLCPPSQLQLPHPLPSQIYGAYKLKIYGTSFYFFVTNNIFLNPDDEVINEKYDLKGSWVKRNSTPPQIGQRVTCTHCNQKFIFTGAKRHKKKASSRRKLSSLPSSSAAADDEDLLASKYFPFPLSLPHPLPLLLLTGARSKCWVITSPT